MRRLQRLGDSGSLPFTSTARLRRLLGSTLDRPCQALVIGPTAAARQGLPSTQLDVVGTNPRDPEVTVVSEAMGEDSLPRHWRCVIVTDTAAPPERLAAAVSACQPAGVVVLARRSGSASALPGLEVERVLRSGSVEVVVARVPG